MSSIAPTMSLPMSWMSPATVPSTTVPSRSSGAAAARCGFSRAATPCMISPAMISSGMNASPQAKRSPMMSMARLQSSRMAAGSAPSASRRSTIARVSSSRSSTRTPVSSSVIGLLLSLRPGPGRSVSLPCTALRGGDLRGAPRVCRRARYCPSRTRRRGRRARARALRSIGRAPTLHAMGEAPSRDHVSRPAGDRLAANSIRPAVTGSMPLMTRATVVFPAPLVPSRATTSPWPP